MTDFSPCSRRRFLRWASGLGLGGLAVGLGLPVMSYLQPEADTLPAEVDLGSLTELAALPKNASRYFRYDQWTSLLIRRADGSLHAFSARCTHADCTVSYDTNRSQFVCACHGGVYDQDGKNVSGPPPKPLRKYYLVERNGRLVASLDSPNGPPRRGP